MGIISRHGACNGIFSRYGVGIISKRGAGKGIVSRRGARFGCNFSAWRG